MNTEPITIEKGVPLPPKNSSSELGNALRALKVGDSFKFRKTNYAQAQSNVCYLAKRVGIKVTTRSLKEGEEGWIRVWRTE